MALLLLLLPFAFYLSNAKSTRDHNIFDRVVVSISAPVQWLTVSALDAVQRGVTHYVYLVGVREENDRLKGDNARLQAEVIRREEYRLENERLRRLLSLKAREPDVKSIVARVIATAPTPLFRSIRVDRGADHGVTLGAAVVNQDGIVGRVAALGGGTADVMLLVDANSSLDVLVQRTRARARVRGSGSDTSFGIEVEYLARTEKVEPGDLLIASGTGPVFPKGLAVGTIVSVERGAFGLYQHATAEPRVDFGRLEEVWVIPAGWPGTASFEEDGAPAPAPSPAPDPSAAAGGSR
ncbi:MAG: rod shape-determining protein MreC [Deltaproteobacteria bacterium]|nr:rod shape-determining protein MreC [Deltaproteobacteria bacterium]